MSRVARVGGPGVAGMSGAAAEPQLKAGALNLSEATVTGLSNMAPAMSLFFSVNVIAGTIGAAIPFVFILAMLGILATANTLSQFTRIYPSAGSFVTFITRAFNPTVGAVGGTFLIAGYTLAAASVYSVVGGWTADVLRRDLGVTVPWQALMIVGMVLMAALLVVGVEVSTRAALVLFLFETTVLLLLGAIIVVRQAGHLSATPFAPPSGAGGLSGIATAFALAIFAFVGWEASAPLAEETDNPRRNVPIALITGVVILAAIYVFVTYTVVIGFGVGRIATLVADQTAFSTLAATYLGPLRGLIDIAGVTSILAGTLALSNTQGRIFFHGGRVRIFPSILGRVNARYHTPAIAIVTYMAIGTIIVFAAQAWLGVARLPNDAFSIFGDLATFGTLPLILIYGLTNIALIVYTARGGAPGANPLTHYVLPAVGAVLLLAPVWNFTQPASPPFDRVVALTLAIFVISVIYGLAVVRLNPTAAERAGAAFGGEGAPG